VILPKLFQRIETIDVNDAARQLDPGEIVVVDVRELNECEAATSRRVPHSARHAAWSDRSARTPRQADRVHQRR
jgi:rhodanese-related sulfurtransferase